MEFNKIDDPPLGSLIRIELETSITSGFLVSVNNGYYLLKNKKRFWKHFFQPSLNTYKYQIPEPYHHKKIKEIAKMLDIKGDTSTENQNFHELFTETETMLKKFKS